MNEVKKGSEAAARELLRAHQGPVFGYLWRRMAPAREDAEEVLQDIFLAAVRAAGEYDGRSSLLTWLCGIGKHKVADHYRRMGRQPPVVAEFVDDHDLASDADPADRLALREAVDLALAELPSRQRGLLIDKYERGRTVREMAEQRRTTVKAVESALTRGREAFATAFRRVWGGEYQ